MGTYQASFTVPNLERETTKVPISSVVLSSQRVPLTDAVYSVQQKIATDAANPLVYDGQRLMPSVTRVFSKSRELVVFLQAYQRGATTTQPLVAFVSFYRGDVKAFETTPLAISDGLEAGTKAVPLRFSLPLESVAPGRYDCQVLSLIRTDRRSRFGVHRSSSFRSQDRREKLQASWLGVGVAVLDSVSVQKCPQAWHWKESTPSWMLENSSQRTLPDLQ
jgi:hypothetical protein